MQKHTHFLHHFEANMPKKTTPTTRKIALKALQKDIKHITENAQKIFLSQTEDTRFVVMIDTGGVHILNTTTRSHTILTVDGHFQSKIGQLYVPVSASIVESEFFNWLDKPTSIVHHATTSSKIPQKAIKAHDIAVANTLKQFTIDADTTPTSPIKLQSLSEPIRTFLNHLRRTENETALPESSTHVYTATEEAFKKTESVTRTGNKPYLLPKEIESFVKTEKLQVGDVTCHLNCLLDLSLAFHKSSGFKRLAIIMEVLFLGIPARQEKGELIREPLSSKWNDVTKALQEISQTLYSVKQILDIENAQNILKALPLLPNNEQKRLVSFAKSAYGFISWYKSSLGFSVAQQDLWEQIEKFQFAQTATLESKETVSLTPEKPSRIEKTKPLSAKKAAQVTANAVSAIDTAPQSESIKMLSSGILTPTSKILSLRKSI